MKQLKKFILLLVVLFLAATLWYLDFTDPSIAWDTPDSFGKDSLISLSIEDQGKGLRRVKLSLKQADISHTIFSSEYPLTALPWQSGPSQEAIQLTTEEWASDYGIEDGPLQLIAEVEDQSNLWLFSRTVEEIRAGTFDTKPPRIDVLSNQHYIRQGGSEAVLYRVVESNCRSGVKVGGTSFQGYEVPRLGDGVSIALFAMAYDQGPDTPISLWAEDLAGNRSETKFWYKPFATEFRKRRIEITDRFIDSVAPEILSQVTEIEKQGTPLETFLQINSVLRKHNNRKITEITTVSNSEPLWNQPFLQLSNSKVESVFADHRTYYYQGQPVDEQTHLGFDLASLARSSVEASNSGKVVFADYLGIYGNCIILDHGLGLFSLYGHLSAIDVENGQEVSRGQTLGKTGQTGLAGGDHLHYSMIVQGVQVTPMEWWDPNWVQLHLLEKLYPETETKESQAR